MKKILALLITFTSVSFFASLEAQDFKLEDNLPMNPKVKMGKLDNGVTYYIRSNPKPEDKVELRLVINAGSVLETDKQLGLAHFMEHMCFNGTKNFEKNELVNYLQSIGVKFGADLNAYTSFDETVYILPIPSDDPDKLESGFQVIEDWAHNATLTDKAIDDERGVVLEEYRLGLGANKRMLQEYLPKLMHGSKYADRLPIGTKEVLENFKYEEVRNFYKDWYRPDLMAVMAVGDLSVEEMEKKIKAHFSGIKPVENPKKREEFDLPNHAETFIAIASDKEAPFSQVQIMYKDHDEAKAFKTYGDYRYQIVKGLFSTMLSNRLNELRNQPNPPFVFASSSHGGTFARTKEAYQSFAVTSPDGQLRGFKALLVENERVRKHGFVESELERARASMLAGIERQYNDRDKMESNRLIGEYIRHYLTEEPMPGIEVEFELYKKFLPEIKLEEVNSLIKGFIHDDNRVIIFTGPEKEGLELVTEAQVKEALKEVSAGAIEEYAEDELPTTLITELPKKGSVSSSSEHKKVGSKTLELSNGAKLTYKITDFKNDEILFSAYSPGGTSLYSDEEWEATTLANGGLTSAGIGGLSLTDLQKFMSGKIAGVRPSIGSDGEYLRGSAAPKDLELLFQMTHLYFTDLNKDDDAYQSFITKQKGFLGNLMADPNNYFRNEVSNYRNKGNSRYMGFPTPEMLDEADYDLAHKKYMERFADAGDFHFYFVGNVDEAVLKAHAEQYLASLPGKNSNEKYQPNDFRLADKKDKLVVKRGSDPKSSVQISWEEATDYEWSTDLRMRALGEVLSIKLVEILREEEGGVYGVGARGGMRRTPYPKATMSISFPCGPENVDKLIDLAIKEVEKIKKDGVLNKDLAKVKETWLVDHKENVKTNRYWLSGLQRADKEDYDPAKMLEYEDKVNALTSSQLQEVANKYLDENHFQAILLPEDSQ